MGPDEYRDRARRCRVAAARSDQPLRGDFLDAAEAWELLADQLERLNRAGRPVQAQDEGGSPPA